MEVRLPLAQNSAKKTTNIEELKPVYLIYGDEQLLLEEAVTRLKNMFSEESDLDFNYNQFFGDRDGAEAVIQAAETLPFMSSKRLVLIKDVEKIGASDIRTLADYIDNSSPTTCLVLVASEVNKSSPLYKTAHKKGQVFEYKFPSKKEYPNWIKKNFKGKGHLVTEAAVRFLVENVGYNLTRLGNEIEKISLFYANKLEINEEDVTTLICQSSEKNIFDLVDSIGKRDKNNALLFLKKLMEKSSDPPQLIFFMIVRQFRLLLKTKSLIDRDLTDHVISKELKIPFFVAKKLRDQCGNFSIEKLQTIYRLLAEVDLALKTSAREPGMLLENLLVRIMD